MENESKSKGKKPRMKSVESGMRTCFNEIAELLASPTLREVTKAGLIQSKLSCLQSMALMQSEEKKARLKNADVDALTKEVEQLRKENTDLRAELDKKTDVKPDRVESFEERLARLVPKN